ncbi:hypothetical protein O6H91_15G038000 [Diphasiastrum complanatum]|uniref:Uncharacterized protein n=1 Tax=Diphasiastrum complanatum TaxID=34168 RepID=A0ACC2BHE5_DIPCM|nr:hypothetical protein O6H91_Y097600 [Diphasiastrum complanatum]KAJ7529212.1 hypothetical protein O6H91_15G038000 [Diphasiastrum complanatum]
MSCTLLGGLVPDFEADSTIGKIHFHDYIQGHWAMLFSQPNDLCTVCTSELASIAASFKDFEDRNVKLIALSCNDEEIQIKLDIESVIDPNGKVSYAIVSDVDSRLTELFGMLADPDEKDESGRPLPARSFIIVGPDKKLKASTIYPSSTGRNFLEALRLIDSLQLTAEQNVETPAQWNPGDKVFVGQCLSNEEARKEFPGGFESLSLPSGKDYIRLVDPVATKSAKALCTLNPS